MFTKRKRNSPSLVCVYNHSGNCCISSYPYKMVKSYLQVLNLGTVDFCSEYRWHSFMRMGESGSHGCFQRDRHARGLYRRVRKGTQSSHAIFAIAPESPFPNVELRPHNFDSGIFFASTSSIAATRGVPVEVVSRLSLVFT